MDEGPLRALLVELIRFGVVPEEAVIAASDECLAAGDEDGAHDLNMLIVEAGMTPATEREKRDRRAALRIVSDGGNERG
jgi:hypothetical protein